MVKYFFRFLQLFDSCWHKIDDFLIKFSKKKILFFVCFIAVAFGITVARRPDVITYPEFWAEDGVFWYSEAYNSQNALLPFLIPKQQYFQTISRIGAYTALHFPLENAPLVFNLIAIFITILPALFFLSARFEKLVPKISHRFFLCLIYLILPGASEVHANLTNAQWHLALLMILAIIVPASKKTGWKVFDSLSLLISGLSGPFVFIGFPISLIYSYLKGFREKLLPFIFLAVAFFAQLYSFLFIVDSGASRSPAPLGASTTTFFKILAGNVFLKGTLSPEITRDIRGQELWISGFLPIILGLLGIAFLVFTFWKSRLEARLFLLFSFLILVAGVISPQVNMEKPQWNIMANGAGGRYYFLPILAWIFSIFFVFIFNENKVLKIFLGLLIITFIFVGIPRDFVIDKFKNNHFKEQVREFDSLNSGETYTFKINPNKWRMTLIKK